MKRLLLGVWLVFLTATLATAERVDVGTVGADGDPVSVSALESNDTRIVVRFDIGQYTRDMLDIDGEQFFSITMFGAGQTMEKGSPDLPQFGRPVIIPDDAEMQLTVLAEEYVDFPNTPVGPSKGWVPPQEWDDTPFMFGEVYQTDGWYPAQLATIRKPFIQRDVRGTVIDLSPFRYNPVTKTLRVYTSVTVELTNVGPGKVNVLDRAARPVSTVKDFERIYADRYINYKDTRSRATAALDDWTALPDFGELLIIVYDDFYDQILELAEWKTQKGMKTYVVRSSETHGYTIGGGLLSYYDDPSDIGKSTEDGPLSLMDLPDVYGVCCYGDPYAPSCDIIADDSCAILGGSFDPDVLECGDGESTECEPQNNAIGIKNYVKDFYAEHPNLVYVLLVGGDDEVSTPILSYLSDQGTRVYYAADPAYSQLDAFAFDIQDYPDLIVGRFSAENADQLATMIERTIEYERDLPLPGTTDLDWFHRGLGIARADDPVADTGYDHVDHIEVIANHLRYIGMDVDSIYETEGVWSGADVSTRLNEGRAIVNYAGHGGPGQWGTNVGVLFTVSNVYNLENAHELPFIVTLACETAPIDNDLETFGESWIRATNDAGEPVGAIATYNSSITQSWPGADIGQSRFNVLLRMNENTTFGSLCFNAGCYMKDVSTSGDRHFSAWLILGDPSVQVRTATPTELTVTPATGLLYGSTSLSVHVANASSSANVEGAMCALYYQPEGGTFEDGAFFGVATTDADGNAIIPIEGELPITENVRLTVTGYNLKTEVQQIPVTWDLVMFHDPLPNTNSTYLPGYDVICTLYTRSGLIDNSPQLNWEVDGVPGSIQMVEITYDVYMQRIPAQQAGTIVTYDIFARNADLDEYQLGPYEFEVYDYHMALEAAVVESSAPGGAVLWFDLTVTNEGALDDSYDLTVADDLWATTIWSADTTEQITNTGTLTKSQSLPIKVRVVVGDDTEGATDTVTITATSTTNPTTVTDAVTLTSTSEGPSQSLPFVDNFETTEFSPVRWELVRRALIDDVGINEPSEPYSMRFRTSALGMIGRPDTVISKMINLAVPPPVAISYKWERTGGGDSPEEGDDLFVEYFASDSTWKYLASYPGGVSDMTTYSNRKIAVPADGYHCRFRVRFHHVSVRHSSDVLGLSSFDDWFVDDICVDYDGVPAPEAPALASPATGTRSTGYNPTLVWHPSSGATEYQVVISNDEAFGSIYGTANPADTIWQVTPALANGVYYWRVRAKSEESVWSHWSQVWTYEKYTVSSTSCPVLYTFDGQQYVKENPLLTACERFAYQEVVADFYQVQVPADVTDGTVSFQLRELEDEITYLDDVELIVVDHDASSRIGCSVDGQVLTYSSIIAPVAAVDHNGADCLAAVIARDGNRFESTESGYLLVTFPNPGGKIGVSIAAGVKPLCTPRSLDRPNTTRNEDPVGPLAVSVANADNTWRELTAPPPRENEVMETIMTELGSIDDAETVTFRVTWDDRYLTDVVCLIVPAETEPTISWMRPSATRLISTKTSPPGGAVLDDGQTLTLYRGDIFEFDFSMFDQPSPGMVRDYVVKATGRYEPDYAAMLPSRFTLYDNYPNPFNPSTTVEYDLPVDCDVALEVYNMLGQKVTTLVNEYQEAGHYEVQWNSDNESGGKVATGVYLYRLSAGDFVQTRKMVLLK